jgi:hypothetical protein
MFFSAAFQTPPGLASEKRSFVSTQNNGNSYSLVVL